MRIGIDARPLISNTPSGIGVYLLEILRNLDSNTNNTYILYSNEQIHNLDPILDKFEKRVVPGKTGTLVVCFKLAKVLKKDQIDVFWGTEHMIPLFLHGIKKVLTVHDLALLINPTWGSTKNAIMQNIFCRMSCKCADRIIAVSNATKKDIVNIMGIDSSLITMIYNGGTSECQTLSDDANKLIASKMQVSNSPFFAYVGNIEPRKNILNIIKAFELLNQEYDGKYKLILAGKMGWKTKPICEAIEKSSFRENIILPGYISGDEKQFLLKNAEAFVYPSNYEGFGIPVIEAFSVGGLVITNDNSSLREVGGDAAFYILDSKDYNQIFEKMKEVIGLTREDRYILGNKGKAWVQQFSWEKCARETQFLLEHL